MILVTGGMSGIGAALVARLRGRGHAVRTLDRAAGADIVCDLADMAAIDRAAAAIGEELSGIAHVAGVPGTADPRVVLAVNLMAPMRLTALLRDWLAPGARIVAVSSVTAHRCQWADAALRDLIDGGADAADAAAAGLDGAGAYELSKRALNLWVTLSAARLHAAGVRVNGVSPGPVYTPIMADFEASMGKARLDAAAALTGRHGRPGEIAAAIDWLLTGDCGWVNGVDLKVDGGFHALRAAAALD